MARASDGRAEARRGPGCELMARRRQPAGLPVPTADQVPPELLDHGAAAWTSSGGFEAWCRQHLGRELQFVPLGDHSAFHRFSTGVQAWAAMNGFDLPGQYGGADWARLSELGVRRPRRGRFVPRDGVA